MKPTEILLSMFPSISLKEEETIEELISLFDDEIMIPDKYGYDERIRMKYNKRELIENILTGNSKFDYVFLHKTDKGIKYNGWFITKKSDRSYFKFRFSKNMNKKYFQYFFEKCDSIASIIKPRFGIATMWQDGIEINDDEMQGLNSCMYESTEPIPAKFLSEGPLGVGLRTYFNEDIINLFGRDFLLNAPAYVEELDWGGIRMDLVEEPWNTEMDIVFESWIKVMDYLKEANVFSEYIYRGEDVMAKVVTSEKWKTFVNTL